MQHKVEIAEQLIANRTKLGRDDALRLAREATTIIVAKGKKTRTFNLAKEPPDEEELLKAMLGPTGNLRAPTVKRGKILVVGFNEDAYRTLLS